VLNLAELWENKNFILIIVAWFVISYLILWVIGGACANPINGSGCMASGSLSGLSGVPIIGLFLPFDAWNSLMYFLAPIAGFILAYFAMKWWNDYFDSKEAYSIWFLIIAILVLVLGYYVNLSFYMGESANLNSRSGVKYTLSFCFSENTVSDCYTTVQKVNAELVAQAQKSGAQTVSQYIPVAFWPELRKSMFMSFIFGAIAAWIPFFVYGIYRKYSKKSD
jgi:hypothetical protein